MNSVIIIHCMQFVWKKLLKHTVSLIKNRLLNSIINKVLKFLKIEVNIESPFKIVYLML